MDSFWYFCVFWDLDIQAFAKVRFALETQFFWRGQIVIKIEEMRKTATKHSKVNAKHFEIPRCYPLFPPGRLRRLVNRMSSFSKRWQRWQCGAWTSSMRRVWPTWHGPLRQWVNRMSSFSKRWQRRQSGAWTSSMRRVSPTLHGP